MGLIGGCCLAFIAIFFPPFPVFARTGCSGDLILNILLTLLGWIPGLFHAWYIILRYPDGKHRARRREREYTIYETRSSRTGYAGSGSSGARRHHHKSHYHGGGGHHRPAPRPAAAQALYYPPQEVGHTRRHYSGY